MRQVMIGTPCYDGRVDCRYADSLAGTLKAAVGSGLNICPVYMPNDALIQRSRNDLLQIAVESNVDDLVFIDSDQAWRPESFFQLLSHPVHVVGVPVRKKSDTEQYNVRARLPIPIHEPSGLLMVAGIGTGFLRLSRHALRSVWMAAAPYENEGKASRMAFDVRVIDGQLYSEDIVFCESLEALGFPILVDPSINCLHVGSKVWASDFAGYLDRVTKR